MKHILALLLFGAWSLHASAWGFFGHRLINRNAVFTLPEAVFRFYKQNLNEITDHAVDPDRRRYSDPAEGCRHYIDLDHYEQALPIDTVPHFWKQAVIRFTEDTLLAYGIVPWHIPVMLRRLTEAFRTHDRQRIVRLSAEIGHYMADACVPLHTSENHNGQLTGQHGIHGFWESRLPELFSEQYRLSGRKAAYLTDVQQAVWEAVTESHAAVDSVLDMERRLSVYFPSDRKYGYVQKGSNTIKIYSEAYSAAYHAMLAGMVERRIRRAIFLTGCLWYTAWVDAGQPELKERTVPESQSAPAPDAHSTETGRNMLGRQE